MLHARRQTEKETETKIETEIEIETKHIQRQRERKKGDSSLYREVERDRTERKFRKRGSIQNKNREKNKRES